MKQSAREKIALVVFLALIALTMLGGFWYMNVGHSWNVAANNIDDAYGNMDGYTVILYDGVTVPTARDAESETVPVTYAAVDTSYESKNANVLKLDVVHPSNYEEGSIIRCGDKRIGVFSVQSNMTQAALQDFVDEFKEAKVDYIVCIAKQTSLVKDRVKGVDIVISLTRETGLSGTESNGTYYVVSPSTGKIGALLISPHDVVSSKDLDKI